MLFAFVLAALFDAAIPSPASPALDASVQLVDAKPTPAPTLDAGVTPPPMVEAAVPSFTLFNHPDANTPVVAVSGPASTPESNTERTLFAIKVIGGLLALLALAYLGGHRRVTRFQERIGLGNLIAAGFPFVALGLIASQPRVGILTGDMLERLKPVLHFGLGWLGFIIGAQLDTRLLDRVPRGTGYIILVEAIAPFLVTATACGALMIGVFGSDWQQLSFWRDLIVLGTAAAMTAPRKFRGLANRSWSVGRGVDILMAQLDEIVGVVGLLFITAYFRDTSDGAWQLPATAWVFVSIGLGVVIGVLVFAMVRMPKSNAEFLAVVLGAIAFGSGLAGYLHLSPIVICFIAGALLVNFPCEQRDSVFRILNRLERPVHLLFLIVIGAMWTATDWRGWALVPLFVVARIAGKFVGISTVRSAIGDALPVSFVDRRTLLSPLSSLSIALVVSVETLHGDMQMPWIVTAVIGGAIISELLVQLTPSKEPSSEIIKAVSVPLASDPSVPPVPVPSAILDALAEPVIEPMPPAPGQELPDASPPDEEPQS